MVQSAEVGNVRNRGWKGPLTYGGGTRQHTGTLWKATVLGEVCAMLRSVCGGGHQPKEISADRWVSMVGKGLSRTSRIALYETIAFRFSS